MEEWAKNIVTLNTFESLNVLNLIAAMIVSCAAAISDIRSKRIPNWLTYSAMVLGVGYHIILNGGRGFLFGAEGLLLGIFLLIFFYLAGGMGAGDVKLMGAVGALLGPKGVFIAFLFTALAGGIYAIMLLLSRFHFTGTIVRLGTMFGSLKYSGGLTIENPNRETAVLNYGVCIAIGVIFTALWDFYVG